MGSDSGKGVLEPREPREGAIRKEGKTCQAIVRETRLPPPETGFF